MLSGTSIPRPLIVVRRPNGANGVMLRARTGAGDLRRKLAPDASERPSAGPAGRTYRGPCEPGADVPRGTKVDPSYHLGREVLGGTPLPQAGPAAGSRSLRERPSHIRVHTLKLTT